MESTAFLEERRHFRFLAVGAVLCFALDALIINTIFLGPSSISASLYRFSWVLRPIALFLLGLSLLWVNGWKTKEQARLFGLLFFIDFSLYLFSLFAPILLFPPFPRPEIEPIQAVIIVSVLLSMLILSVSLLTGGKGSRVVLIVFLTIYATSVFYGQHVTGPRIQAWMEAQSETLKQLNAQSTPSVTVEVTEVVVVGASRWVTYTFYLLTFIYLFFLRKDGTRQTDPSAPP